MIVRALAPAKVNLGLEILGLRNDGYHEIRTIMAAVSLFDRIQVVASSASTFSVDVPGLTGADNLVIRALDSFRQRLPDLQLAIAMRKRIPVAAGLGGASSDAAATLIACDLCYGLGISREIMLAEAVKLGSDIPFFLIGGIALAAGKGELIAPLPRQSLLSAVIVAPYISIPSKTATLYGLLRPGDFSDGGRVETQARIGLGTIDEASLKNAFERPLYEYEPSLRSIAPIMRKHGAKIVALTGAGPAHYALEMDHERAHGIASGIRRELRGKASVHTVRFLPHGIITTVSTE